jgi:alpha/beta superfamily hydrolase
MSAIEESVFFPCGPLRLAGSLRRAPGPDAVAITHPHPLYGGEMHNPVVDLLAESYQRRGYTTLRFNFRGVGASEGRHDDGRGEREDVRAAAAYLTGLDKTVTDLAGYSFGAWVNLSLHPPLATVRRQLLVAPPVAYFEIGAVAAPPAELAIIAGDRDSFAPLSLLREQMPRWHPAARLRVLPGVDHFFRSGLEVLAEAVADMLSDP